MLCASGRWAQRPKATEPCGQGVPTADHLLQHEAVHQARTGDRVEIVGHWHGFDCWDPSGNLGAIQVFLVERFRVVGG